MSSFKTSYSNLLINKEALYFTCIKILLLWSLLLGAVILVSIYVKQSLAQFTYKQTQKISNNSMFQ